MEALHLLSFRGTLIWPICYNLGIKALIIVGNKVFLGSYIVFYAFLSLYPSCIDQNSSGIFPTMGLCHMTSTSKQLWDFSFTGQGMWTWPITLSIHSSLNKVEKYWVAMDKYPIHLMVWSCSEPENWAVEEPKWM